MKLKSGKSWSQPKSPSPVPRVQVPPSPKSKLVQPAENGENPANLGLQKDVLDALECPVCRETAAPPVTLCKIGHFICGICRKKVDRCVICRNEYTEQRCFVMENIVSKLNVKFKCHYKPSCDLTLNIDKLVEHLDRCDYRPVVCNSRARTACVNKPIDLEKFVDHLKEVHGALTVSTSTLRKFRFTGRRTNAYDESGQNIITWAASLLTYDDISFILSVTIECGVAFFWVSAIIPESQRSNYSVAVYIGQKDWWDDQVDRGEKYIKWKVGIASVHATLKDMKRSGDCVAIPASQLISLSRTVPDENEGFSFAVELRFRDHEL